MQGHARHKAAMTLMAVLECMTSFPPELVGRQTQRMAHGMNEPHIGLTIMQFPTLLKALMLQPGIGLFSLVIRQNRRIDYRKGDHDLP